ncbi:GDYXXLXY domain-containing protein [Nocardioides gilvus]|uniref:GDYXXLXY domain-containing protein n=1 Tax=Nocardioides gilvus TaxID=1735589 RepID=UPI000D74AEFD|nr:GDYXXLXY domain-containing protein [Nocardioides gilvus]
MKRTVLVTLVAVSQLALVGVGVAPQLSARVNGETVLLKVAPVDPIDPFRGAYVVLDYPDLDPPDDRWEDGVSEYREDHLFIVLEERDGVAVGTEWTHRRPESGLYLACAPQSWAADCGIESWFVPQDEALQIERDVASGHAVAEVRVDSRGNAAITGLRTD